MMNLIWMRVDVVWDYHDNYYIHVQLSQYQSKEQYDDVLYMYHKKHDHRLKEYLLVKDMLASSETNLDNDVWKSLNQIVNHMMNISLK